jgi:hypothetical protein
MHSIPEQEAHPIQQIVIAKDGVKRFRANKIVQFLLDKGPFDMNFLAAQDFGDADREQFAQLIGYSVSGFGGLPYVSDKSYKRAARKAAKI